MSFIDQLTAKWKEDKFVCVGLDQGDFEFDKSIIDQTFDLSCAYKLQSAFYESKGTAGLESLQQTVEYIRKKASDIPIILDAKRGDIGNTNKAYVKAIFDDLGVDAVTVHPYLGQESLQPFLERKDKGVIVLVKTSNPGAGEFQNLIAEDKLLRSKTAEYPFGQVSSLLRSSPQQAARYSRSLNKPFYQVVAEHVKNWNTNGNCAAVAGATYPQELKKVREIVGDMPILVPGIGTQGGDLEAVIKYGLNSQKQGLIISSSRSIIFAPNPKEAALKLHQDIVGLLKYV